ncbi:MAG TPA: hypothetical protein VJH33_02540 [Candidatus Paceibacterota bacterium]
MARGYALMFLCTVFLVILVMLPMFASAQVLPERIVPCNGVDCGLCDIALLAQNVLNTGIFVAVFLSSILFAWAGIKYVTAQGDSGKVTDAKKIFWNVTLGLVIILVGWITVDTLMKTLTRADFGPWNAVCVKP